MLKSDNLQHITHIKKTLTFCVLAVVWSMMIDAQTRNGITVLRYAPEYVGTVDIAATRYTYKQALEGFSQWLEESKLTTVTGDTIRLYKSFLVDKKCLGPKTVSTYLSGIRGYFNYCIKQGLISEDPTKGIKNPKLNRGHSREAMTIEEAKVFLSAIDRSTLLGKRDYAMIYLMLKCGLREIEIIRSNIEDLRPKDGAMVLYIQGKAWAGKNDFVVIVKQVNEAMQDYLQARGKVTYRDPLFASVGNRSKGRLTTRAIRERVNYYLNKSGVKRRTITTHSLRHTAATMALEAGAPIFEVKQMLRHVRIETTMIYLHEYNRVKNGAEHYIKQI